jgi:PqqD family protein of HPr-rel-A system
VSRLKKGLLIRDIDGEVVVLDPERDQVHQFNASASLIWRLYKGGKDLDEIAKGLATEFDLDQSQAQEDSQAALAEFRRLGLIS